MLYCIDTAFWLVLGEGTGMSTCFNQTFVGAPPATIGARETISTQWVVWDVQDRAALSGRMPVGERRTGRIE